MHSRIGAILVAALLALSAGACVIEDHAFEPSPLGRIVASPATVEVTEGQATTFAVHLEDPVRPDVTVTCAPADPNAVSVEPFNLFFSATNAGLDQTVVVSALDDANIAPAGTNVMCSATAFESSNVMVNVTDDDVQLIVVTPNGNPPIMVTEGQNATVQVRLAYQPLGNTTVAATSTGGGLELAPASMIFQPNNFSTPQLLTLHGVEDADAIDDAETIALQATGAMMVTVPVLVVDND
jgi:hypothetical protein